jgi:predicted Zn-dependent peptidase
MKRTRKPVFFIVALFIIALGYTTIFGVYGHYGDRRDTYIRGAKDIRFGIDIKGGVDVTFGPKGNVKNVTETEHISQGKLSMGFRTKVQPGDGKYPSLIIFNAVLGGGPSSKLFNNVREKLSLAYYASSRIDMFKGIMTINSGIEVANFQKAYDEILLQLDAVKNGDITDEEMSAAILGTANNIKSITDSAIVMEDYSLNRLIVGSPLSLEELTQMVQKITKEQVVEIANNVELDTVYFMKGEQS